jgi:hypothetical protein
LRLEKFLGFGEPCLAWILYLRIFHLCFSGYTYVFPMSISTCYQVEDTSWIQVSILAVVNALVYPYLSLVYCMFTRLKFLTRCFLCFSVHCS